MELQPPKRFESSKSGNRPDECEDASRAVYPLRIGKGGSEPARIVVVDGASESAFARPWAQILAQSFVDRPPDLSKFGYPGLEQWLAPGQEEWRRAVPWDRIPWHGEAKARAGAAATLLGLTISRIPGEPRRLAWQTVAVGDSCLFLIRQDKLILSFPLEDAAQFNNTPALLCSNPANNSGSLAAVQQTGGTCQAGDVFILASDALAGWLLSQSAAGDKPWQTLLAQDSAQWEGWVREQREARAMRNDDTTLIIVPVAPAGEVM